jgi:hypothetical protein
MPTRRFETEADATADQLFATIADLSSWPAWDPELQRIEHDGSPVRAGSRFRLKPRGGPVVAMTVEAADPPHRFVDVARLPFARMRTEHLFEPLPDGRTRVSVTIATTGPLAFLWDRVVAAQQAAGAAEQARAMAAHARGR